MDIRRIYLGVLSSVLIAVLSSCAATGDLSDPLGLEASQLYVSLVDANRSGDANELEDWKTHVSTENGQITYSDDLIEISFPEKDKYNFIKMRIKNRSETDINIDWREVDLVDDKGDQNDVLVDGAVLSNKYDPEWNEEAVTTTIEGGETVHHAFLPFEQIRSISEGYSPEDPNIACVGKSYDKAIYNGVDGPTVSVDTDPEVVEELGVEGCSVVEVNKIEYEQISTSTYDKVGTSFSVNIPMSVGENTAIYTFEFQVDRSSSE